ncbi:amino acid ABC transporter substrate-binding protein [Ramlibacter sp. XY19]|uniref:amino acid ABC transporter substrate-binding protein n=1 Tax=Ramlibacter paludis TaxID=2908000 RepID=UPI0023DA4F39|nr:amino acid ABC transporter substrate-binding protein [Ramlibacter paludis]MCG2592727.1 amino acid ABC transporter substrate-binding protein [Ramlibacter paludis]
MVHPRAAQFLLVLALAASAGSAGAQAVLKRIADRQQVTIGYTETAAPFSFLEAGKPVGYAVDLCADVAQRLRGVLGQAALRSRFVPVDQDNVARLLRAGSVDLLCGGISDTPQRRQSMDFSAPIYLSAVKLLVRADGPQSLDAMKGRTVAVIGRTTAEDAIADANRQRALQLKAARVVSPEAALSQLRLKQADAWARDEVLIAGSLGRETDAGQFALLPEPLSKEVIAIAMPRDEQLRKVVNEALADAVRSGRLEALHDKWFVQPNSASAAGLKRPLSPELKAEFDRLR